MNHFYLVRHGKTLNNVNAKLSGWIDTPLTPDGLEPTNKVIEKLKDIKINYIYSSDLGRAFITAYAIQQALAPELKITAIPGLREVNYGDAANMLSLEAYAKYPKLDRDTNFTPPNGESLSQMQQRVIESVANIDTKHSRSNILLVAHSGVMAAIKAHKDGIDFGEHNISEAYEHDCIVHFMLNKDKIISLQKY